MPLGPNISLLFNTIETVGKALRSSRIVAAYSPPNRSLGPMMSESSP